MEFRKKSRMTAVLSVLALSLAVFGTGCSHAKPQQAVTDDAAAIEAAGLGSSDDGKAYGMQTVHFAFDSNLLDTQARELLKADAAILAQKPGVAVQIEGHCDARGGIQYNIALGERRARAVRSFLVKQGIAASRLETVSYGKERPLVQGDSEEAYAKNRRAAFVVTTMQRPQPLANQR
jgi:peptidoglycan-associated lipoprotein